MGWWYVSGPYFTCVVEVTDGVITEAPPILRRFVGQPAKNLGDWMRSKGEATFERIVATHFYSWGNNPKRQTLKGRPCRVLARGTMRSVLVEFENGQKEVVSIRALRRIMR